MLGGLLLAGALASGAAASPPPVPATPIFRSYGVADGLPSADVYTVTQDHAGYIWIGTHAGLVRYDSRTFKLFTHVPGQPASLPANDVSAVLVDRAGNLWAGGEGTGLNLYQPATGGFRHWLHNAARADSIGGNDIMAIAQDKAGAIWVGTYAGGLDKLAADRNGFVPFRHQAGNAASIASDDVTALAAAADGGLWIGTDAGLDYMRADGSIRFIALPGAKATPSIWQLRAAAGGVDAATSAGLFHIAANGTAARIGPAREAFASLRQPDGDIWIAQRSQIERIDRDGNTRVEHSTTGAAGGLPGQLIDDLFGDDAGGLWVATMDGGLAYLPPHWRAFSAIRHVPGDAASLSPNHVRALALAPDGSLWAGGVDLLDHIDPVTRTVRHIALPDLAHMSIGSLAVDGAGRVWIGGRKGLNVWDGQQLHAVAPGNPALKYGVAALFAARNGAIYVAGLGQGTFRLDVRSGSLEPLAPPAAGEAAREVLQLGEAPDGSIWAASHGGVARLAPRTGAFTFVPGIPHADTRAFTFAPDGSLWLATDAHLQHYRLTHGRAQLLATIGTAEGWPGTRILGVQVGAGGRVFATDVRSILMYDPHTRRLHTVATANALAITDFMDGALLTTGHEQLFAGSLAGVIGIRTDRLPRHFTTPKVVLESVEVRRNGQRVTLDPARPITLDWRDRELTVTARVLSYIDPARNQYRFRLQGFDPGWVDTGARDVREFSLLEPGSYQLLVSGRTGDGPWSSAVDALSLHVQAAPWTTPWAKAGYALLALLLAGGAVVTARRRLQQRHRLAMSEERQQLAEHANMAKSRFLANMAHEIRTPLTGVLGMTELLLKTHLNERQFQYADAIRRSGALLLRQVNDALDVARIEAGRLELTLATFDPAAILREVADADAGLAAQKHLTIDVVIAADAPSAVRGDALRVQQILFNLTHNALKFTTEGGVTLKLDRDAGGIVYSVIDQGPGMTPEECARVFRRFEQADYGRLQRGSGLGLAISQELVGLMSGRISVQSEPGRGSAFSVRLPLPAVSAPGTATPETTASTPPEPAAVRASASGRSAATQDDRPRVLLVEDDVIAGQAIAGLIETFGYHVTLVPQALAALAEIDSGDTYDAMVFDFDLPGMGGCELAALLRRRGHTTPIVGLTASAYGDEEQRARAAGMGTLVRKPVPADDLRAALARGTGSPAARAAAG
ncbi:MAG: hybrid sensor histidine kinase/response regulator [Rhodanobacteraceae bacterium]|nr:MAG: hybrid sensor histidine kinase/response regulator [Rhodanobacteraceae bacterium]